MHKRLRLGGSILAALVLAIACLGFTSPARGDEEPVSVPTYLPSEAKLTKVIIASNGTDASGDNYVFQFEGKGVVRDGLIDNGEDPDLLYSDDGIEQDKSTLSKGDTIPEIPDVTISGRLVDDSSSIHTDKTYQTVNSKTMEEILQGVTFDHAGIYTYRVSEKTAPSQSGDNVINSSKAAYILRVRVENDTTTEEAIANKRTVVKDLTVEKVLTDEGKADNSGKIDPGYPIADANGKITNISPTETPQEGQIAGGDERGRDVYGFTFANEYLRGGSFVVKKLVKGNYADKTKKFHIVLELTDEIAKTEYAKGCVATYIVSGGDDVTTSNELSGGGHTTLNGVYDVDQSSQSMVQFDETTGTATIEADLNEGGTITVTGIFGPYSDSYSAEAENGKDKRMTVSATGPSVDTEFKVTESTPGNYTPTGYVNPSATDADPRESNFEIPATWTEVDGTKDAGLEVEGAVFPDGTIVYVVNELDDSDASLTGVLIDNLPYILMVGVPIAVFAGLFVIKHRNNVAA